jgi:hypothetical protein
MIAAALYAGETKRPQALSPAVAFGAKGTYASSAGRFVSRSGAANATNRAAFGGRRAAQLADASGGS